MYFLVYASSAVTPFSPDELRDLLDQSQQNNAKLGLTGMLLYKDGNFMQVLEGEEAVVRSLIDKVELDPRHQGMLTILEGSLTERQFPEWSMGFRNLNSEDGEAPEGYSEFMNAPLTGEEFLSDPSRCQKLLMTFKKSM